MLCNRDNWQITEETEAGIEELNACLFKESSAAEQKQAEENAKLIKKLIAFCMENWDNEFMREVKDKLHMQRARLIDKDR